MRSEGRDIFKFWLRQFLVNLNKCEKFYLNLSRWLPGASQACADFPYSLDCTFDSGIFLAESGLFPSLDLDSVTEPLLVGKIGISKKRVSAQNIPEPNVQSWLYRHNRGEDLSAAGDEERACGRAGVGWPRLLGRRVRTLHTRGTQEGMPRQAFIHDS